MAAPPKASQPASSPQETGPTNECESEWPLCERIDINHASILERHTFLRFRSGDAANVAVARRIIGDRVEEIISYFYAHL